MKTLVDAAHRKGMKVFFDIITNHTADVIDYQGGQHAYVDKTAKPYLDANGKAFDDKAFAGGDTFPKLDAATIVPLHAGLPHGRGQDGQGAGVAQRPHDVPQPRRLHLSPASPPSTATSPGSTTSGPSSPRSSTA